MLSEEQISKLVDGRYVEGAFGLDEGDVFPLISFEVMCYRITESGKQRLRMLSESEKELRKSFTLSRGSTFRG